MAETIKLHKADGKIFKYYNYYKKMTPYPGVIEQGSTLKNVANETN
jgi:hypothetical protein